MLNESTTENYYELVGRFLSVANTIEFLVNSILEVLVGKYALVEELKDSVNETIDHIQEQSIRTRVNYIIILLTISKGESTDIRKVITELQEFVKFYNKSVRNVRDFIAHNPIIVTENNTIKEMKIVSSRRYKKSKLESMSIVALESVLSELIPYCKRLNDLTAVAIQKHYQHEPIRDI